MACRPRISRMLCAIWFALSRRDMNWPIRLDGSEQHESSRNVRMAEIIDDNLCHPHVSGEFAGAKRKLSTDQEAEKQTGALTGRSGYPSSTVFPRPLKAKKAGGDLLTQIRSVRERRLVGKARLPSEEQSRSTHKPARIGQPETGKRQAQAAQGQFHLSQMGSGAVTSVGN